MPPLPIGPDGERMASAFDRLGWHWWPSDSYVNSVPYRGRQACNNCGNTGLGCSRGAKGQTDVAIWPEAIANGVELRTDSRVFRVDTDGDGRAIGASYYDADGEENFQPAKAVVLAMNGIGSPAYHAEFGIGCLSVWSLQFERVAGQELDVSPVCDGERLIRRWVEDVQGSSGEHDPLPRVLRDKPGTRTLCAGTRIRSRAARVQYLRLAAICLGECLGARNITPNLDAGLEM